MTVMRHLSADPLRQFDTARVGFLFDQGDRDAGLVSVRAELGPSGSALRKAFSEALRRGWLTWLAADKLAIALGRNPEELWGWDWWDD